MGTMSASDAAPLPVSARFSLTCAETLARCGWSWYADTGVAVFSIWQGDTCTGTFRLPIPELPRMVEALAKGPPDLAGSGHEPAIPGCGRPGPGRRRQRWDRAACRSRGLASPVAITLRRIVTTKAAARPRACRPLAAGQPGFRADAGDPDAAARPDQDLPGRRGYGAQDAGYAGVAPWLPGRSADGRTHRHRSGSYGEPPPGSQHQMPEAGYYQDSAPEGHHDLPPAATTRIPRRRATVTCRRRLRRRPRGYRTAGYRTARRYQDTRYRDAPPGGYEESGSAAPGDYQDLPPGGGYRDLPPGGGYRELPPGADYHAPVGLPGAAARRNRPSGGPVQFAGRQQDSYPPTGPLPVGRWRTGAPDDEFPQAPSGGPFAPARFGDGGSAPDRLAPGDFDTPFRAGRVAERVRAGGVRAGGVTARISRDGFGEDEGFADEGFADGGFPDDPLAGGYQGEAEQGYLPSPPTDVFPAASLSGDYHGQGNHRAGYEPDPDDPDGANRYPAGHADHGGPPRDSAAYRQGRSGGRERE